MKYPVCSLCEEFFTQQRLTARVQVAAQQDLLVGSVHFLPSNSQVSWNVAILGLPAVDGELFVAFYVWEYVKRLGLGSHPQYF